MMGMNEMTTRNTYYGDSSNIQHKHPTQDIRIRSEILVVDRVTKTFQINLGGSISISVFEIMMMQVLSYHYHHLCTLLWFVVFMTNNVQSYTPPTWQSLEKQLKLGNTVSSPKVFDSALRYPLKPDFDQNKPTLFRERHGWCPYSERVWLALEYKGIDYDTVLIDNTGPGRKPDWYSGNTPQMRWSGASDSRQGESMDLMRALDEKYPDTPMLYCHDGVDEYISAFRDIFPKGARPSSRAAFLFSWNGEPLFKSEFERVLRNTDEILGRNSEGPFFCGSEFSAADIAWAPFLERYAAQLPCLHDNLDPRDDELYPNLTQWFIAMDNIPCYACRVKGNSSSWRKVLNMAGFGNGGAPPLVSSRIQDSDKIDLEVAQTIEGNDLWEAFHSTRPYLASSPGKEAASVLLTNRDAIMQDTLKRAGLSLRELGEEKIDVSMRALAEICSTDQELIDDIDFILEAVDGVGDLATFLDSRMCVPRDMGSLSAIVFKRIAGRHILIQ